MPRSPVVRTAAAAACTAAAGLGLAALAAGAPPARGAVAQPTRPLASPAQPGAPPLPYRARPDRPQGLDHVALRAVDFDRTVRFYTEALGFRRAYQWDRSTLELPGGTFTTGARGAYLDAGDGTLLEVLPGGRPATPDGILFHYCVHVRDVDAAYRRALAAGATPYAFHLRGPAGDTATWGGEPVTGYFNGDRRSRSRAAFVRGLNGEVIQLARDLGP